MQLDLFLTVIIPGKRTFEFIKSIDLAFVPQADNWIYDGDKTYEVVKVVINGNKIGLILKYIDEAHANEKDIFKQIQIA